MKKLSLSEKSYLELKKQLFEMNSGDFLSIRHCAIRYGTSYTPMRNAFLRLEEEGFLKKIPEVGYFVQKPDYVDFCSLFQVRKCIEPYTLKEVFRKITPEELDNLMRINLEIEQAQQKEEWERTLDLDIELHNFFCRKYGNAYLEQLYTTARNRYKNIIIRNLSKLGTEELQKRETYDHSSLIEAIRNQDLELALALLNDHIDGACIRMTKRGISVMNKEEK